MQRGHLPLIYRVCPTIKVLQVFDHLAKRVSMRRGGRPVPHLFPVEAA
jgi:hypothetical protein